MQAGRWRLAIGSVTVTASLLIPMGVASAVTPRCKNFVPGANLSGCNLAKANLAGVNLTGANLTNAVLTGANLTGATMTKTKLGGAAIAKAKLDGVTSGGATGAPASLPTYWEFVNGYLVGPHANLTNANLVNATLSFAHLAGATITGAKLAGANFYGVRSGGITTTPASMPGGGWVLVSGYFAGPGANLIGARFAPDSDLHGADLDYSNFDHAVAVGVDLSGSNLSFAILTSAQLPGGDFSGTDLDHTNLDHANLRRATSGGTRAKEARLPVSWSLSKGYLVGPAANLSDANLVAANLAHAVLRGAVLTGAQMARAGLPYVRSGGIVGAPASLPAGWRLLKGYLVGARANLAGANLVACNLAHLNLSLAMLSRANLSRTNLTGTSLGRANLAYATMAALTITRANLAGANLTGVVSGGIKGTPAALPAGWQLVGGRLIRR
jgi:uncharacterized protein YjbI with pentapeptide repeats